MKSVTEVDAILRTMPEEWRTYWCSGEAGPCACGGCVQIGNRIVMYEDTFKRKFVGDPEYIDERGIPVNVYERHKVTKEEWLAWKIARSLESRA